MLRTSTTRLIACSLLITGPLWAKSPNESSVRDVPGRRIAAISEQLDGLVQAQLAKHGQRPNEPIDDETFLRRIYLDVVGRIPTLDEARAFLRSKDPNKRAELIDQLLDSPGYRSHQFNYWADLLRLKTRLNGGNPGRPYIEFVKESLAANTPYDEFVRQLIAAEGPILERGNGAAGYYLRDQGMPEDNMANTVRVFLGTRLECAQCHDHPFDKWTQREFFEMVAFAGGTQTRYAPNGVSQAMQMRRQLRESDADARVKQVATQLLRPLSYGVFGGGTALARLPDSYQYEDGEPNEIVTAKTMFEHQELVRPIIPKTRNAKRKPRNRRFANRIPGAQDIGSRSVLADWMTSPDNPRFTKVIANRLWKQAMGLGLVEPVDDLTDDTVASNPELLTYLSRQMVDLDYDMRQYLRAIYNSRTYQRASSTEEITDATEYFFPGPVMRRLSAEQLWDSFLTMAVPDLDTRENPRNRIPRNALGSDLYEGYERVKAMSLDEVLELAEQELAVRNDPDKRRKRYREAMMASNASNPFQAEADEIKNRIAALRTMQKRARKQRKPLANRQLQRKISELANMLRHVPTRISPDLVRASEVQSPAPAGHFLREFGQSDRDQIQNSNKEPAVSQVLSLMNGQIEKRIMNNPRTVLMRNVVMAKSLEEQIETVFLSMLSRFPSQDERSTWKRIADSEGEEAISDLIWTLANTGEFMFVF